MVHRDVKPSNILIDGYGEPLLADFGLASHDDDPSLTATGDVVGTLLYAAPEQLAGRADARADQYSLGATLYHVLTGSPPITAGDRLTLATLIPTATPRPATELSPATPS